MGGIVEYLRGKRLRFVLVKNSGDLDLDESTPLPKGAKSIGKDERDSDFLLEISYYDYHSLKISSPFYLRLLSMQFRILTSTVQW